MTNSKTTLLIQFMSALVGGLILTGLILGGIVGGYQYSYQGKMYPGVSVAGIDLSGLTLDQAVKKISGGITYPLTAKIAFQDNHTVWSAAPIELGLFLDAQTSANMAYAVGRTTHPTHALTSQFQFTRIDIPPQFVYDERVAFNYLQDLANQINVPTVEATLGLDGIEVLVHSGQVGRELDLAGAIKKIEPQFEMLQDGLIMLNVVETPPVIIDVTEQAAIAKQILSAPLVIRDADANPENPVEWVIEPESLAKMLSIERVRTPESEEIYQIAIRSTELHTFLEKLSPGLSTTPANARFIFNDETRELEVIEKSVTGRALLIDASVDHINQQLAAGEHRINLVFDYILPAVPGDAKAEDIGVTELVSAQTSYFYGSSASRIHNIAVASARFHGVLVGPGETFSMGDVLGDISLDTGFAEALIIFGDRTIKGVGGGVCQVSTTLFRTVFFGGFEIEERYPHAYRVYYYELAANGGVNTSLAGLDATVYVPLVDFKFTNNSEHWLLMETYVNEGGRSLTWKFYSTSDGRSVEWTTTGLKKRSTHQNPSTRKTLT